jgi:hypothetical protein
MGLCRPSRRLRDPTPADPAPGGRPRRTGADASVLSQKFARSFRPLAVHGCVAPSRRSALDTRSSSRLALGAQGAESARELLTQDTRLLGWRAKALRSFRVALALVGALHAPAAAPAQGLADPGAKPLEAGERALAAGRRDEAARHFIEAWAWRGPSAELAGLLLRAAEGDVDAVKLWAHVYAGLAGDSRGKVKLPADLARIVGKDPHVPALVAARAAAVAELLKLAGASERKGAKEPGELLVARWLRRAARMLAADAPALVGDAGVELDPRLSTPGDVHAELIGALEAELARARVAHRLADAVDLARVLRGLGRQAGLKDLQGEAPDGMEAVERRALAELEDLRAELGRGERPWTVAELEALSARNPAGAPRALQEAFTRAHASMGAPAVAVSPTGKYRIETECGFETLLGVARTIEAHHARLVAFYGRDPFDGGSGRQGIVRIVPEASGLEAEGAPFFWAGGFQSGDVTTLRFSLGDVEGLGHGLVHELTHRFDGALFPGQMAWLGEGKAVWTGAAYGGWRDAVFVPNHASFGTIERAWIKGYGGVEKLKKLLDGTIEEYRDNYFAGYALYVFLMTEREGERAPFAGRMREYMEGGFRGNRDPLAWFGKHFVDGREGRPETYEELAERFHAWTGGFYWQDRKPWTSRYTGDVPDTAERALVHDAPTWTWSRARAEPSFGQDHARAGARLLARLGRAREAADAFVWGLSQDGRTPRAERELAALADGLGRDEAAWVLRAELGRSAGEAPLKLPRTRALLAELEAAARDCAAAGAARAAGALAADHDRLAAFVGAPALARPGAEAWARHPFDRPAEPLGVAGAARSGFDGWVEDGLTGYEDLRVEGLWYAAEDGALHVGRERPRAGTGTMDRSAHQRQAFVRSTRWNLPGRYVVSAQVQLTTSFVDAALVIGYTRRDRNVRVHLNAGDFLYSIGVKEGAEEIKSVGWRCDGLFDRDNALPGARPGGVVDFGRPVSAIHVDLLVDGATLHVIVDGAERGTYRTADGAPIEGYAGFATGMGAIKVQRPTVQRLDRADFGARRRNRWAELPLNRALDVDVPPNGMLYLRMAQPDDEEEGYEFDPNRWVQKAVRAASALAALIAKGDVRQRWSLVVSERLAGEPLAALRAELASALGDAPEVLLYPTIPPPTADDPEARAEEKELDTNRLVLIDPTGTIRVRDDFFGFETTFTPEMERWLMALRENGFPERRLPPVTRGEAEEGR